MAFKFEWDPQKAVVNLRKHEVSFEEAATAFSDPLALMMSDPEHSKEEDHFILLGKTRFRRTLVVIYVERGERLRIISARRATRTERSNYEENAQS